MQKVIYISPLKRPPVLAYLGRGKLAKGDGSFETRRSDLPPCVTILPPLLAEEEHMSSLIFGLKVITELFKEAESSRISLRSLLVLENEDSDILVARAQYPSMIQAAIMAAYEHLPSVAKFAHAPPLGAWTPHVKLLEGIGIRSELAGRAGSSFGAVIDENISPPILMTRGEEKWEIYKGWSK